MAGPQEAAAAEAKPDDRIANGPIPAVIYCEPAEECLVALEKLLQRVDEQTLAESARTGEEVVLPLIDELSRELGLVDVVVAFLADLPKGLDADG